MDDKKLRESVLSLARVFKRRNVNHALIGGLAVGARSRPRSTKDADFIVHVPALSFPGLLEELVEEGFEIDVLKVIRAWSADRFVVFYRGEARFDWMQPILPVYNNVLNRAEEKPWLDSTLRIATAEGIIITKMLAFRPQDQADIDTLLVANRDEIDIAQIRAEWAPFAAKEPERTAWLEDAITRRVVDRQ